MTSYTSTVTQDELERKGLVSFKIDDTNKAKLIDVSCSPVPFDELGTKELGDFFEAFLDEAVNIDLAFSSDIKEYLDSFWIFNYYKIFIMLFITRILPLMV